MALRRDLSGDLLISALENGDGRMPASELAELLYEAPLVTARRSAERMAREINAFFGADLVRATEGPLHLIELKEAGKALKDIVLLDRLENSTTVDLADIEAARLVSILGLVGALRYFIDHGPGQTPVGLVYRARDELADILRHYAPDAPTLILLQTTEDSVHSMLGRLTPWEVGLGLPDQMPSSQVTHLVRQVGSTPAPIPKRIEKVVTIDRLADDPVAFQRRDLERTRLRDVTERRGRASAFHSSPSGLDDDDNSSKWLHVIDHVVHGYYPPMADLVEYAATNNVVGISLSQCFGGTALFGQIQLAFAHRLAINSQLPVIAFDGQLEDIQSTAEFADAFFDSLLTEGLLAAVHAARQRLATGFLGGFPTWCQLQLYL